MANPTQNPNEKVEQILRTHATAPFNPAPSDHVVYLSNFPPPYPHVNSLTDDLQYVRIQHFAGRDDGELGTIQIFQNEDDAYQHWTTLKGLDSEIIMRPQQRVKYQSNKKIDYHLLVFEKIIRDSRFWFEAHTQGQVSDEDFWELIKKIVRNLRCLSTEMQPARSHGDLEKGIGVRSGLQVVFYNLGATNAYLKDVQELDAILTKFQQKVGADVDITNRVNKLKSFLFVSCLAPNPPAKKSILYNRFSLDHNMLIFNYPSVWNEDEILRFVANLHKLCSDNCHKNRDSNLLRNYNFRSRFIKGYSHWNGRVTDTTLKEVYNFGAANRSYQRFDRGTHQWVLSEARIVSFSHNSIKHACERAQRYNNKNKNNLGIQMLPEHVSSEILVEIRKEFPYLIEDSYEAFHEALVHGYKHHKFTIPQILTGRL